jgi:hypothetical protein
MSFMDKIRKPDPKVQEEEVPVHEERSTELPAWGELQRHDSVELKDMKDHEVTFMTNEPEHKETQFGRSYVFVVRENDEERLLFVSSIKLAYKIKKHEPLTGKTLKIRRVGSGFKTDYVVESMEKR